MPQLLMVINSTLNQVMLLKVYLKSLVMDFISKEQIALIKIIHSTSTLDPTTELKKNFTKSSKTLTLTLTTHLLSS